MKKLRELIEDEKNLIPVYKRLKVLIHLKYMLTEKIAEK